jgi:hypothetical protein
MSKLLDGHLVKGGALCLGQYRCRLFRVERVRYIILRDRPLWLRVNCKSYYYNWLSFTILSAAIEKRGVPELMMFWFESTCQSTWGCLYSI